MPVPSTGASTSTTVNLRGSRRRRGPSTASPQAIMTDSQPELVASLVQGEAANSGMSQAKRRRTAHEVAVSAPPPPLISDASKGAGNPVDDVGASNGSGKTVEDTQSMVDATGIAQMQGFGGDLTGFPRLFGSQMGNQISPEYFTQFAAMSGLQQPPRGGTTTAGLRMANPGLMLYQSPNPGLFRPNMNLMQGGTRGGNGNEAMAMDVNMLGQMMDPRLAQALQQQALSGMKPELLRMPGVNEKPHGNKKVPKLKSLKSIDPEGWRRCIQKACGIVFHRLELKCRPSKRTDILSRITKFKTPECDSTQEEVECPCFLVQRENTASKSPFQVQVSGARILAQKIIYAGYNKLDATQMGTWQVQQTCCHPDGTWWCFEPSHLEKCERDHVPSATQKNPIPSTPDAVYVARNRQTQSNGGASSAAAGQLPAMPEPTSSGAPIVMPSESMEEVLERLQLPTAEYLDICKAAGIDTGGDFVLFSEPELQNLGFKQGHIRRIFAKIGRPTGYVA